MPTVTDEYGRKREISREEFLRMLANVDPGGITIQEVTTNIYTGKQTVRNIPVSQDGSFDLYGTRMRFDTLSRSSQTPSYSSYTPPESKAERERRLKKEEERRKQQTLENEKVRSQVPEEMRKLMQQADPVVRYLGDVPENPNDPNSPLSMATLLEQLEETSVERMAEAARTQEEFEILLKEWDRLDRNRERRERYHEILKPE